MSEATPGTLRLDRERSLLLVVDIQERLAPHIHDHVGLVARTTALLDAAVRLGIPRRLTEHCSGQIGPVLPALRDRFAADEILAKTRFGATDHPAWMAQLHASGRTQIVVAGMEAHVCVMQTVLGLCAAGFTVFAAADAIGAREARQEDRRCALARMAAAGAHLAGTETILFEWMRAGDDPAFRDILALVKALP